MTHEEWRNARYATSQVPVVAPPLPVAHRQKANGDRLLVLAIALLLWQNGAATELILALLYIAM